jgi:hypothetical protein
LRLCLLRPNEKNERLLVNHYEQQIKQKINNSFKINMLYVEINSLPIIYFP